MELLYTVGLFVGLYAVYELTRKSPGAFLGIFLFFVLAITPYWITTHDYGWFHWAKIYSVVIGCLWVYLIRFKFPDKKHWPKTVMVGIFFVNILEAVIKDLTLANYFNAIAGILLLITMPAPKSITASKTKVQDMLWNTPIMYILGYTVWNHAFVFGFIGERTLVHMAVLGVPLAIGLIKPKEWLQARGVTLGLYLILFATYKPVLNSMEITTASLTPYVQPYGIISFLFMSTYSLYYFRRKIKIAAIKTIRTTQKLSKAVHDLPRRIIHH